MRDALSQRRPFDPSSSTSARTPSGLFQAVDGGDVGMVQRGEDSGLTLEPGQAFGIIGEEARQNLEGYIPAELGIVRAVDLPHPALADEGGHVVMAEAGADC